jgi:LacI family transcriptional regulator
MVSGLSPATVDRVLNERPGVSAKAKRLVEAAIRELAASPRRHMGEGAVYDVILPDRAGMSTDYLAAAFRKFAEARGAEAKVTLVERLNPDSLSRALTRCAERGSAGIAFQAVEDPAVRETASQVISQGTPLVTVVSDLNGMGLQYVGLDNRAAGRTAGYLMGLMAKGEGPVAVIWGGHLYRGHDEREFGFRSALRGDHPGIEVLDVTCTQDDADEAYDRLSELLAQRRSLAGVYSVGGGILGAVKALQRHHKNDHKSVLIGHNLTANTRDHLLARRIDALIHQDMLLIAEKSLNFLAGEDSSRRTREEIPIQIVTRENVSSHLRFELLGDV